jgi:hypothetical protein
MASKIEQQKNIPKKNIENICHKSDIPVIWKKIIIIGACMRIYVKTNINPRTHQAFKNILMNILKKIPTTASINLKKISHNSRISLYSKKHKQIIK